MRKCVLASMACLLVSGQVWAEDIKRELDEVVVTGSRVAVELKETASAIDVVSTEELDTVKYRNPSQILNRIAGVTSQEFDGESELTSIRVPTHFTNPYTVVLVDGVPTSSYGSGASSQFRNINNGNIERIEVLKGPASALYGSNAIGGIINIITKSPKAGKQFKVWSEYGDELGLRHIGASGRASSDKFGFTMDLNYKTSDGWRENSAIDKKSANIKLNYPPTDNSILSLAIDYVNFDNESPGSLDKADFDEDWQQSYHTFAGAKMNKVTPSLAYSYFFDNAEFKAALQVRDMDHETFPNYGMYQRGGPTSPYYNSFNDIQGRDYNAQLLYSRDFAAMRSKLVCGVDLESGSTDTTKYTLTITRDPATNKYTGYTMADDPSRDLEVDTQNFAPYAQLDLSPMDNLRLSAGVRYDATDYKSANAVDDEYEGSKDFSRVTPKIGLTYDLSDDLNTYLSISEGFVVPSTSQLFTSRYADPDLAAEVARNYEIGLRGILPDNEASFELSLYNMTIEDKIISQTRTVTGWGGATTEEEYYENAGETSHRGVELNVQMQPVDFANLSLTYTYALNEYEDFVDTIAGIDYSGNTMARSPQSHFNGRVTLMPLAGLNIELEVDAVSSQYVDSGNQFEYKRPVLAHLRTAYEMDNWSFWLHVLNLTDQKYAARVSGDDEPSYYPGKPRTIYAGVSYTWGK